MPATKADKMLTIGMRQSFAHHTLEWMNICKLEDIVLCDRVRRDDLLRSITQTGDPLLISTICVWIQYHLRKSLRKDSLSCEPPNFFMHIMYQRSGSATEIFLALY